MSDSREQRKLRRERKERAYKRKRRRLLGLLILIVILLAAALVAVHLVQAHMEKVHRASVESFLEIDDEVQKATAGGSAKILNVPARDELKTVTDENGETVLEHPDYLWVLVNKEYHLPSNYEPADLVQVSVPFAPGRSWDVQRMRPDASDALTQMFSAAKEEQGYELYAASGYRSYDVQRVLFNQNVARFGSEESANFLSAKAGQSEHQTGLAMDLTVPSLNYQLKYDFESTPEGKWVAENSWRFGFIVRYKKDKTQFTGYSFEPWHVRYVGTDLSKYLYEKDLTLEEYYGFGAKYSDQGSELIPDNQSYE